MSCGDRYCVVAMKVCKMCLTSDWSDSSGNLCTHDILLEYCRHTQQNHLCLSQVSEVQLATEELKVTNHQALIKSHQNWLRHGVEQFAIRSIILLFLFGIRRNCMRSGSSRSSYLSIGRAIKQIAVIIAAYHFCILHTKFCPTSSCQG